jgi:hypothetical protein
MTYNQFTLTLLIVGVFVVIAVEVVGICEGGGVINTSVPNKIQITANTKKLLEACILLIFCLIFFKKLKFVAFTS